MNKYLPDQPYLSKTVLAGVFAGIAATLANLFYDLFFRTITQFVPSQIINVATIIFTTMLFFTIAGGLYFFSSKFITKGTLIYILVFAVLSIICFTWGLHVKRSDDPLITANFRGLFLGIITISGGLATFFIPYLMKHQSIYLD